MVSKCSCEHAGQDKLHGPGNRVKNITAKGRARCTVCGSESGGTDSVIKKSKKK